MEITWLGYSSTRLVSGDIVLLNDPFPDLVAPPEVHIVAVTNDDPLHSAYDAIGDEPHLIDGPDYTRCLDTTSPASAPCSVTKRAPGGSTRFT